MSGAIVGLLFGVWGFIYLVALWREKRHAIPASGRSFRKDWVGIGGLALATLGFFWQQVFTSKAWVPAGGGDLASFIYPMLQFTARHLKQGVIPLWNPYLYGGAPFAADIQSMVLYPLNWLFLLLSPEVSYRLVEHLAFFHIFLAGVTMYLCLRWLDPEPLPAGAALTGAIAYMFSDLFLIHLGNLNLIAVAAWLPLSFLFFHRALRQGSLRQAALSGLFTAFAVLAGHIQIFLFIVLLLGGYTAFSIIRPPYKTTPSDTPTDRTQRNSLPEGNIKTCRWRPAMGIAALFVLTLAIAVALSAVVLVPATEMASHTKRAELDYREASEYSLPPAKLIGLFIPSFFERDPSLHWGPWDRVEIGYLGVFPLVLALLALILARDRLNLFFLALTLGALFVALGSHGIVHGWLYALIPGFDHLRAPARIVVLMDFGLAALAARGLGALMRPLRPGQRQRWRSFMRAAPSALLGTILLTAPLAYYALLMGQDKDPSIFWRIARAGNGLALFLLFFGASILLLALRRWRSIRPATLGLLAAGLVLIDLAGTGAYLDTARKPPTSGFDHPEIVAFLKEDRDLFRIDSRTDIWHLWQPDTPLLHDIADVWGVVNPLVLADYDRYWENMGSRSSPLYDFLNAKYVIAAKDVVLDWTKFVSVFDGAPDLNVYLNRNALPRAFTVHKAITVSDQESAFEAIHAPGFDPSHSVVVENGPELAATYAGDPGTVQVIDYGLNHVKIATDVPAPGYLVLSEVYYPGWQAWVDGHTAPIYRANYTFRAVYLEPGRHEVTLTFQPSSWTFGLALSGTALFILFIWGALAHRRRSRGTPGK